MPLDWLPEIKGSISIAFHSLRRVNGLLAMHESDMLAETKISCACESLCTRHGWESSARCSQSSTESMRMMSRSESHGVDQTTRAAS